MSRSNLISGFTSTFIYPCAPHLAYEVVKPTENNTPSESNKLYSEILTIHSQHSDNIGTRLRIVPSTFILTTSEYLNISKKQIEEKYDAEIDKELRKSDRKMKKKDLKENRAEKETIQLQKAQGECCSCHKLCNDPKKSACLRGGHTCSVSCTCKSKCQNPNNKK